MSASLLARLPWQLAVALRSLAAEATVLTAGQCLFAPALEDLRCRVVRSALSLPALVVALPAMSAAVASAVAPFASGQAVSTRAKLAM